MNYFLDTEFSETGGTAHPTIDLISLGLVCEDGREYYAESTEFYVRGCNPWVKENVLKHLGPKESRLTRTRIAADIVRFIGADSRPMFWAYFADYDWVVFCWLYGGMLDLPKSFPHFCMDLRQWWEHLGTPDNVRPEKPENQHHALADARWNLAFFNALNEYKIHAAKDI